MVFLFISFTLTNMRNLKRARDAVERLNHSLSSRDSPVCSRFREIDSMDKCVIGYRFQIIVPFVCSCRDGEKTHQSGNSWGWRQF